MEEIYTFTARVVDRLKTRMRITPEDRDAFFDYLERVHIDRFPFLHGNKCLISVGNRKLMDAAAGADRVRYSVEKFGTRMRAVGLEAIPPGH